MVQLCIAPNFGVVPTYAQYTGQSPDGYFPDTDEVWHHLLGCPVVGPKEGPCVRGSMFRQDARAATQLNVEAVEALVLDVDEFRSGTFVTPEEIHRRLFGHRMILWTTYNHTPSAPRYRVVLPMTVGVPRRQFRSLWEQVNNDLGNVVGAMQFNADRLGYLPRIPREEVRPFYFYCIFQGEVFDPYRRFGHLDETPDRIAVGFGDDPHRHVDKSSWLSDDEARARARRYCAQAHIAVEPGARHHKLFEKSCQLWWDFYLEADDVVQILQDINQRFTQPKDMTDVLAEVEAGYAWTRGPAARQQAVAAGSRREKPPPVTRQMLLETAKRLKRRRNDLGDALKAVAEGFSIIDDVRDAPSLPSVLRGCARVLADEYRQSDARQIAELFADQLRIARGAFAEFPSSITVDSLTQIVAARQEEHRTSAKQRMSEELATLGMRIEKAMPGRRHPYTVDEFAEYARQQGCSVDELRKRLIVTKGPSFFFFNQGGYTDGYEHNVNVLASQYLAAAEPLGVDCFKPAKKEGDPPVPKSMDELMHDYGVVADEIQIDLAATRSGYVHSSVRKTLALATTPLRVVPEYSEEVDRYLRIIGRRDLVDWLSWVPNLSSPLRLLYLWGPKDAGKTMFPSAVSRLWSTSGPAAGSELFGNFNESVVRCPLVFMDEKLPDAFRGDNGTNAFRDEIQLRVRPLTGKFKATKQLVGCLRFVLSANSPDLMRSSATHTKDDAAAVAERLLLVHLPPAAVQYLAWIGHERLADAWVGRDLFAKHVMWLREHHEVARVGRFGPVPQEDTAESRQAALMLRFAGDTTRVLDFLYQSFQQGQTDVLDVCRTPMGERHIVVDPDELTNSWGLTRGADRVPRDLSKALDAISVGRADAIDVKGTERMVFVLDEDLMHQWMLLQRKDVDRFWAKVKERKVKTQRYSNPRAEA